MQRTPQIHINLEAITDNNLRQVLTDCLQIIEALYEENASLKSKLQKLGDEHNRLKGEQGKPKIRPNNRDISSTKEKNAAERPKKENHRGKRGKKNLTPDRTVIVPYPDKLPDDAKFKGHESVILSSLKITVENVEYKLEKYHSKSKKKTYIAPLPGGSSRDYDVSVQAMVIVLNKVVKSTQSKIRNFLTGMGLMISSATISRMISNTNLDVFIQEKAAIFEAGIKSSSFLQSDDTMARVKGKNCHAHIFGNDYFTVYFTEARKDRITLIDCLRLKRPRQYLFNEEFFTLLHYFKLPRSRIQALDNFAKNQIYSEEQFSLILSALYPDENKLKIYQSRIREAAYIAAYHQEPDCIQALLTDDAPQFQCIALNHALCWIHEARHYKKMTPIVAYHKTQLKSFQNKFWKLYRQFLAYKKNPTPEAKALIKRAFDALCRFKATYPALKERIAKTRANKSQLLYALTDPAVPLHNNDSELAAREKVRELDIHFHTMSPDGTASSDALLSIICTARKLGINPMDYIEDRLSGKLKLPALADLIYIRSGVSPISG